LFAWLTEMLVFQVAAAPDSHTDRFLTLLNGPGWVPADDVPRATQVAQTLRALRTRYRCVTADDVEQVLLEQWPGSPEAAGLATAGGSGAASLRRLRCVPGLDLSRPDAESRAMPAPAHVSVVALPEPAGTDVLAVPAPEFLDAVGAFLAPRLLLTTRMHVVGPEYVDVAVSADLALRADAPAADALAAARSALQRSLDPLTGGPDGDGWPFGRDVFCSDVYSAVDTVALVDYVESVRLTGPDGAVAGDGAAPSIRLEPNQLPRVAAIDLTAFDVYGRNFPDHWQAPR
jgi:hypothetical protein